VRYQAIKKEAELPDLDGVEAGDDLSVAALDHPHQAMPDPFTLRRQREHDTAPVRGACLLAHQRMVDQRLRRATGLAFVQVRPLCQIVDGQRIEGADGGEASALTERDAGIGLSPGR
jgi:hypothetical protein